MNDSVSSSAHRRTIRSGSTFSFVRIAATQRRRSSSVGSPSQRASRSLRDSQSGLGLVQLSDLGLYPSRYSSLTEAAATQSTQPAALRDVREEFAVSMLGGCWASVTCSVIQSLPLFRLEAPPHDTGPNPV